MRKNAHIRIYIRILDGIFEYLKEYSIVDKVIFEYMTDIFEYLFEYKRAVVIYSNNIFKYMKSVMNSCNFEDM